MKSPTYDELINEAVRRFREAGIDRPRSEAMMLMITTMTVVIMPSVTRARTVTGATLSEAIRSTGTLTGPEIASPGPIGVVLTGSGTVRQEPIG